MSQKQKIIVIGGVAAGPKAASRARRLDPEAEITIFTDEKYISYAGCGEPYYIGGEIKEKDKLFARTKDNFENLSDIKICLQHRVSAIDPIEKKITVENLKEGDKFSTSYDKLVIATGASPIIPPLEGVNLPGIFPVRPIDGVFEMRERVESGTIKEAVVVGGGYIGLEMAENLAVNGIKVTLVELLPQVAATFDFEVGAAVKKKLEEKGVTVLTETKVLSFVGSADKGVTEVVTDKVTLPAQMVILSVGIRPNTQLAQSAGIEVGIKGAISTNSHCQTNYPDIYAGGDCAETPFRVTNKPVWIALGSVANRVGRVIGSNIAGGDETFDGVLGTAIFRAFDLNVGQTGLTERGAKEEGFELLVSTITVHDKPHYMDFKDIAVKVIFDKQTRRLLGAQVWGEGNVDKPIDTLAAALTFNATAKDLAQMDLAYAPPFAPALGNVNVAGNVALNLIEKKNENITQSEFFEKRKENKDSLLFVDVRDEEEIQECGAICQDGKCVPLGTLKNMCEQLKSEADGKDIITSCGIGLRAANASRILRNAGVNNAKYLDGGKVSWPFEEIE